LTAVNEKAVISLIVISVVAAVGFSFFSDDYYFARAKNYSAPSSGMKPTIETDDQLMSRQIFAGFGYQYTPRRGDIIVFNTEKIGSDYVKRVVGLPGDRIQMRDGKVYIDDQPLKQSEAGDYVMWEGSERERKVKKFKETLPNGRSYEVLDIDPDSQMDNTKEYIVPDRHVFVLGDNRDNSIDSRVLTHVGYIPLESVKGVARHVYYSGPDDGFVWRSIEATKNQPH
jgi:signal peptidase I